MRTLELVLAAVCGALAALALSGSRADAQDIDAGGLLPLNGGRDAGALRVGDVKAIYHMSEKLDRLGVPRSPSEVREQRDVLFVPEHYGELVDIVSSGGASVFWFRDDAGVLRNASVAGAATRPVRVVRMPTDRLRYDYR